MKEAKKTLVPLFPTCVWKIEFPDDTTQNINSSVLPLIKKKLKDKIKSPNESLNFQTEQNLHLEPEFEGLVNYIFIYARSILDSLQVEYEDVQITGCWANVTGKGHEHKRHSHPNNYLSGVYYVEATPGNNNILFHDPRPQVGGIKPPVKKMTMENTDHMFAEVAPGTMLFFPSWLQHSVPMNQSKQRRISIAFNLMFKQFAETMASPLWKPNA